MKLLSDAGLESYFSCNPANIDMDRTVEMFENGLGYIKYSIESVDDSTHKEIRGEASDFSRATSGSSVCSNSSGSAATVP